jgi:hypothetical protein
MDNLPQNAGLDSLDAALALEERLSLQKGSEHRALYTDVDYNGHVNNVSYIRWIEDAVDPALLERAGRMRLDINYMNEVRPGEITGIWSAAIEEAAHDAAHDTAHQAAHNGGSPHAFAFEGRKIGSGQADPPKDQTAFRAELRLWQ